MGKPYSLSTSHFPSLVYCDSDDVLLQVHPAANCARCQSTALSIEIPDLETPTPEAINKKLDEVDGKIRELMAKFK